MMLRLLTIALCASSLFAAGSVQQSVQQLGGPGGLTWAVVFNWTGDATTGSVPATRAAIGRYGVLQGYYITAIETQPRTPAPTSGYGLTITDQAGVDVLAGAAVTLSSTASQAFAASTSVPPINGVFTLNITGQNVPSARGVVYVYLQDPTTLIGTGSAGPAGPPGPSGISNQTGILEGHGLNPVTGNQAASMLTYLRRQANTGAVTYNFSPLPDLFAGDYYWAQTPGGSVAVGVNTITLTPGPLGVSGTAAKEYVYLTGGVGTAESVLITGGTCNGTGQASCTIQFTAAHTHTGAWTALTASAGIKEAVNIVCAGGTGGRIRLTGTSSPYHLKQTLVIGDGSFAAPSTCNNVALIGDGGGATNSEVNPETAGAMLYWDGPAAGTMLELDGPIADIRISGIFFQCAGSTRAATGFYSTHAFNSIFTDHEYNGCSDYAIKHHAYDNPANIATGANNDIWDNIQMLAGATNPTANGMQIGGTTAVGNHLDVAKNHYRNFNIGAGSSGTALNLRFTDSSLFENFNITSGAVGIKVSETVIFGVHFPATITCIMCFIPTATIIDDTAWTGDQVGMLFWPYNSDLDGGADPVGVNGWTAGFTNNGRFWGKFKSTPALYNSIASSTAIASTVAETPFSVSATVPAFSFNRPGTRMRITGSGKFSTTGSPTLQIAVKLNGNTIAAIPAAATFNNSANFGWSIVGEVVARSIGVGGTFQNGACHGGYTAVNSQGCTYPNNFVTDTTINETVTVTAQWGTSSASNTITMDELGIEILTAGVN